LGQRCRFSSPSPPFRERHLPSLRAGIAPEMNASDLLRLMAGTWANWWPWGRLTLPLPHIRNRRNSCSLLTIYRIFPEHSHFQHRESLCSQYKQFRSIYWILNYMKLSWQNDPG
jgi:hypothetical protein